MDVIDVIDVMCQFYSRSGPFRQDQPGRGACAVQKLRGSNKLQERAQAPYPKFSPGRLAQSGKSNFFTPRVQKGA